MVPISSPKKKISLLRDAKFEGQLSYLERDPSRWWSIFVLSSWLSSRMAWQKGKCYKFKKKHLSTKLNESHVSTSSEKPTPLVFSPAVFTLAKLRAYCRSRCDTTSKKQQLRHRGKLHLTTLQITFQVPQSSTFFSINDLHQKVSAKNLPRLVSRIFFEVSVSNHTLTFCTGSSHPLPGQ